MFEKYVNESVCIQSNAVCDGFVLGRAYRASKRSNLFTWANDGRVWPLNVDDKMDDLMEHMFDEATANTNVCGDKKCNGYLNLMDEIDEIVEEVSGLKFSDFEGV